MGSMLKAQILGAPRDLLTRVPNFRRLRLPLPKLLGEAEAILGCIPTVVELGGGTGQLANHLKAFLPKHYEYVICEPSPGLTAVQESKGVRTIASILGPGVHRARCSCLEMKYSRCPCLFIE